MIPDLRRISWMSTMSMRDPDPPSLIVSDDQDSNEAAAAAAAAASNSPPEFSALLYGSTTTHRDRLVRLLQLHTDAAPTAADIRTFSEAASERKQQACNQTGRDSLMESMEIDIFSDDEEEEEAEETTPLVSQEKEEGEGEYFLSALPRVGVDGYEPTVDDMLALPLPHKGVTSYSIPIPEPNPRTLRLVDTTSLTHKPSNGMKLRRMGIFSDLDGMVYLVRLSAYQAELRDAQQEGAHKCGGGGQSTIFVLDMEGFSAKSVVGFEGDDVKEAAEFVGEMFTQAVAAGGEMYGQKQKQNAHYVLVSSLAEQCREDLLAELGACLAEIASVKGDFLRA
ncbi:hypothetical protein FN846DRAFT_943183 [Sphaerosporella brunnea]|uniref:Uncharacterized protein n=1 Tax=Sphaerosporella brunnea TaxID=1250544 RepID=A0A5J5F142_9PEZI|nr:hypothetical protein FN846DRAFT_943183 [Sphaerosporella brunnea]